METLVVDDVGVIRTLVRKALRQHGVDHVDEAVDGNQAIEWLQARKYHLMVVDWNMPHKSGLEVTKIARQMGMKGPIIMQTTNSMRSEVMDAVAAGVSDYILKPFTAQELSDSLERHVRNAAMLSLD